MYGGLLVFLSNNSTMRKRQSWIRRFFIPSPFYILLNEELNALVFLRRPRKAAVCDFFFFVDLLLPCPLSPASSFVRATVKHACKILKHTGDTIYTSPSRANPGLWFKWRNMHNFDVLTPYQPGSTRVSRRVPRVGKVLFKHGKNHQHNNN